jgi:transcriptional regulator with PAS, ATPase and Fis domain
VATVRDLSAEPAAVQHAGRAGRYTFENIVGKHPALLQVVENAKRAAQLDLPILISGESGTGKEQLAQAIHNASSRSSAPFVGINVIAIPRELLESELFGYEGGAFTGARSSGRAGRFEEAGRGTLLLDEIGDMPLDMQGKLLRVLQERVVHRVGGSRDLPVRARVIATTNSDLEQAVRTGRFRLDLFHRLRVMHLHLPALRERRGDVPLLVEHHLRLRAERMHGSAVTIEPAVLAAMEAYDWPGNVRELLNLVENELGLLPAGKSTLSVIPGALRRPAAASWTGSSASGPPAEGEAVQLSEIVRRACQDALARHGGNVTSAARALGIAKGTLYRQMGRSDVPPPDVPDREPASKPARNKPGRE